MFLIAAITESDMRRHLDLTAMRSFLAVAEAGGVTRAAKLLNLTQSAVSMQMKRLEEMLGVPLLDRSARGVRLTAAGEQLKGYGKRLLTLNDEAVARLTGTGHEGRLVLGVPHDIVYPHVPLVLQRFADEFPMMRVQLVSSYTIELRAMFDRGECDLILTTEDAAGPMGETLLRAPLRWIGAPGGKAWEARPVRLAFEAGCLFRGDVTAALDAAGIPWEMAVEAPSTRTVEASVSADLGVHAGLEGSAPPFLEELRPGLLPDLPEKRINLYVARGGEPAPRERCAELLRQLYTSGLQRAAA